MSAVAHPQSRRRPRPIFVFASLATLSLIATFSLLVAAVVIH